MFEYCIYTVYVYMYIYIIMLGCSLIHDTSDQDGFTFDIMKVVEMH